MDGVHDLGGRQGFGPVEREPDEPVFHANWERRVFGLVGLTALAVPGWNTSRFRHAIERMDPAHYLASPYYEHWATGLATLLVEAGVLSRDELEGRAGGRFPLSRPALVSGPPAGPDATPAFGIGDRVRVRDVHWSGHGRCPGYIRGRLGTVVRRDGPFRVPDVEAHSADRPEEPTYCVRFDGAELWGSEAEPAATVTVDLWARYLEAP